VNLKKPLILIADKDKDIRFKVRMCMRDYDVDFIETPDGHQCIELIKEKSFSLAFINYIMGDVSGYKIAAIAEKEKKLPVILMILEGFDLTDNESLADEFLMKPFGREQLLKALKNVFNEDVLERWRRSEEDVRSGEASGSRRNKIKNILVADDEYDVRELLKLILGRDYIVDTAKTGEELVEKASRKDYDLIISDVIMPKLSGWKSIKKIREKGIKTPVIFNSGMVKDKELYETLKPPGVSRFILKPFNREKILSAIAHFI